MKNQESLISILTKKQYIKNNNSIPKKNILTKKYFNSYLQVEKFYKPILRF